jgi:beta-lactam-binding protein with PASTA domain
MQRVRKRGWPTRPEVVEETVALEEAGPAAPPPPPPLEEPPPERELWPWLLVLIVLVLAAIAAVYFATRDDGKKTGAIAQTQTVIQTATPTTTQRPKTAPARVRLPSLVGLPAPAALKTLRQLGLTGTTHSVFASKPRNQVVSQRPNAGRMLADGGSVTLNVSKGQKAVPVPDVVGQSAADALATLRAQDFRAKQVRVPSDEPAGQVVAQHPAGGAKAKQGSEVRVNLSDGSRTSSTQPRSTAPRASTSPQPARSTVTVPDLSGEKLADARAQLRRLGLVIEIRRVPNALPKETVVAQSRQSGTELKRGDHLLVTVSLGPAKNQTAQGSTIPDVVGQDQASATSTLENAGFDVRVVDQETTDPSQDGLVVDQTPAASQSAPANSTVTIYVGRSSGG